MITETSCIICVIQLFVICFIGLGLWIAGGTTRRMLKERRLAKKSYPSRSSGPRDSTDNHMDRISKWSLIMLIGYGLIGVIAFLLSLVEGESHWSLFAALAVLWSFGWLRIACMPDDKGGYHVRKKN